MIWKSESYRKFISEKNCMVCDAPGPNDPHHEDYQIFNSGMAMKPPDVQCVPLCRKCHDLRHKMGPKKFWGSINYMSEMINYITEYIILKNLK